MKAKKFITFILTFLTFSFLGQDLFAAKTSSKKGKITTAAVTGSTETYDFPAEFTNLLANAQSLCLKNDFTAAMNILKAGDYNQQFYAEYISKTNRFVTLSTINRTKSSFAKITSALENYDTIQSEFMIAYNAYMASAQSGNYEISGNTLDEFDQAFSNYGNLIKTISDECENMRQTFQTTVDSYNGKVEMSYPLLIYKLCAGYEGGKSSGLLGVVAGQWDYVIGQMEKTVFNRCRSDSIAVAQAVTKDSIFQGAAKSVTVNDNLERLAAGSKLLKRISDMYTRVGNKFQTQQHASYQDYSKSADFLTSLSIQFKEILKSAADYTDARNDSNKSAVPLNSVTEIRQGASDYAVNQASNAAVLSQSSRNGTAAKNFSWFTAYTSFSEDFKFWNEIRDSYLMVCNELINKGTQEAARVWIKISTWFAGCGATLSNYDQEELTAINNLLQRPRQALEKIQPYTDMVNGDIEVLKKLDLSLNDGYAFRSNFQEQRKELNSYITQLQSYISQANSFRSKANENINTSLLATNQINVFYNRALLNFNSGNYSQAHTNYDKANLTYTDVIDQLKMDLDNQEETYQKLLDLRQDFIQKERPIIVAEVRNYINEAKNAYYAGDFDQANTSLTRAETRRSEWAKLMDTELDTNEELQRIKEMVNTALSIKQGRIIYPEDPLYPEMSQLLQIAQQYYDKSLKITNRNEQKDLLNKAKNKVNEVKTIYPRNQAASILALKIDQKLDPSAFNTMFAEKISALKKINYSRKDTQALEGYNDLLDLYEINPNYSGLGSLISSVEMDLGMKARPVAQVDVSQAQELARQAQQLLNQAGRDENLLAQARAKANAALAINENNTLAYQVLDEISLRSGGQSAVILSAADEELYQSAVRDLQNDNVFAAKQKIDQLLQKPQNRRSAKILKLQKRIEALL